MDRKQEFLGPHCPYEPQARNNFNVHQQQDDYIRYLIRWRIVHSKINKRIIAYEKWVKIICYISPFKKALRLKCEYQHLSIKKLEGFKEFAINFVGMEKKFSLRKVNIRGEEIFHSSENMRILFSELNVNCLDVSYIHIYIY